PRTGRPRRVLCHHTTAAPRAALLVLLHAGHVIASGSPAALLAAPDACTRAGVRAPDVARVFAELGLEDPPLDVEQAAERLRAEGLHPRSPRFLPRTGSGRPIVEV